MQILAFLWLSAVVDARPDEPIDRPTALAWPAGPLEVRIAFPEPIRDEVAVRAKGRTISFRSPQGEDQQTVSESPIGVLTIAGVERADEGRTIRLLTDPHPAEAAYSPDLPAEFGQPVYDLSGVEASWTAEGEGEPGWIGWLPDLNLEHSRRITSDSVEHQRAFGRLADVGTLTLRTLLTLPEGEVPIAIEADRPFEAELAFLPLEVGPGHRAEGVVESFGEPAELFLTLPTGPGAGGGPPLLRVSIGPSEGEEAIPLPRSRQLLPWAPAPIVESGEIAELPEELRGGDPARGEVVFNGEEGKCLDCHRIGDRGGLIGPDLSGIGLTFDPAAIYHAIEAPSASIAPDYLPYTVAMSDGRVFVGVARAEGSESLRVVGADAEAVILPRSEVEELRPVATSIMPVGLAGALGRDDLRDLLAFLSTCRSE